MEIVEQILLLQLEYEIVDEFPRTSVISDIQSFPIEMQGRVYTSCVRSSMIYGSDTMLLLADVGLNYEDQVNM